jgi:hypothetical protein
MRPILTTVATILMILENDECYGCRHAIPKTNVSSGDQ